MRRSQLWGQHPQSEQRARGGHWVIDSLLCIQCFRGFSKVGLGLLLLFCFHNVKMCHQSKTCLIKHLAFQHIGAHQCTNWSCQGSSRWGESVCWHFPSVLEFLVNTVLLRKWYSDVHSLIPRLIHALRGPVEGVFTAQCPGC